MQKPWGPNEPNSGNQRWSEWVFTIRRASTQPDGQTVIDNFRRWFRAGFKTDVGQARLRLTRGGIYELTLRVEGPPVHDPDFRAAVRRDFFEKFVRIGFGMGATLRMRARLLAGSAQDGRPPSQLIVAPAIELPTRLH